MPGYFDAPDLFNKTPKLMELRKRVESLPGVKEWIAKRDAK